jgi:hypothetical protein
MRMLKHENVVEMKWFFYSNGQKEDEIYLNLVLEYVPETVYQVARQHSRAKQQFPVLHTKVCPSTCPRPLPLYHSDGAWDGAWSACLARVQQCVSVFLTGPPLGEPLFLRIKCVVMDSFERD